MYNKTKRMLAMLAVMGLALFASVTPASAQESDYPGPFGDSPVAALVDCSDAFWVVVCDGTTPAVDPVVGDGIMCEQTDPYHVYVYNVVTNTWDIESTCVAYYTTPITYPENSP